MCVLLRRAAPSDDASDEKETRACGARRVRGVRPRDDVETKRSSRFCPLGKAESKVRSCRRVLFSFFNKSSSFHARAS